jgi:hypothetical protein
MMKCRYSWFVAVIFILLMFNAGRPVPIEAASQTAIREVTFEAAGMTFKGPDSIPSGLTSVRIVNKGMDLHEIQLIRLTDGKTAEDFAAVFKGESFYPPAWVKFVGGPNGVIPGESATAVVNLEPGDYVLTCFIPDLKGIPHVAQGMVRPLKVTATPGPGASEPKASVTIIATDFTYSSSAPISAGPQTIRFNNAGTQPHEIVVVQLPPDKTIKDFAAAFDPAHPGPPPGKPIGGMSGIDQGGHGFFTAKFEPGRYGWICFFMDGAKQAPHFALGMMQDFIVK